MIPFQMVGQDPGSDCRRRKGAFVDAGCKPAEFGGEIADRPVIEELFGAFGFPQAEDLGVGQALGYERMIRFRLPIAWLNFGCVRKAHGRL